MVKGMPESSYELSLQDIVDDGKKRKEVKQDNKKKAKQNNKKNGLKKHSRSQSMNDEVFLLKMFLPSCLSCKKKTTSKENSAQGKFHVSNVLRKRPRDNVDNDEDMELIMLVVGFIQVVVAALYGQKYRLKELTWNVYDRSQIRATWMNTLKIDRRCRDELRLDIPRFEKLCHLLEFKGGLVTTKQVTVKEVVALFLHILAHDLKNRTIQAIFACSGETVSRQFHIVLGSLLKLRKDYIKKVDHSTSYVDDNQWKWFEGAVGALDGTHIKMIVPVEDRSRYRDRKGDISTNVLATCDPDLCFTYVLSGWEGSASDPRVLRDALRRPNGLKVPKNKYFLADLGYSNCEGFLTPYKHTRYYLNLWHGNTPTNYKELFNLRHSSARNCFERAFGLLKKRWAIYF
ncbi:uncharacterized protein LOC141674731 [Apium graveolens]|uniref:uncharacterized protein LOC141674731 n=1 Tax=Apium graveolens TaxID=4045 RepID=UPI003D7924A5